MKKPDEIALYAYMRAMVGTNKHFPNLAYTVEAADALGISHQRAHYLVDKWRGSNWCDGLSTPPRCVYFLPGAPTALLPWGVK